jgi:2'-5' RNA ligase
MTNVHRLFFAIRPDFEAKSMAVDTAQRRMNAGGLSGGQVAPEHLHVTLHWLGDHAVVPHDLLCRAKEAGDRVEMEPFGVGFNRVGSLDTRMGGLALTGAAELKKLRQFQRILARAMEGAEIGRYIRKRFNPHVSLLYCQQHVVPEPVAPIRWRVDELVLIDSLLGCGRHIDLGNWPLRSRQMNFSDW